MSNERTWTPVTSGVGMQGTAATVVSTGAQERPVHRPERRKGRKFRLSFWRVLEALDNERYRAVDRAIESERARVAVVGGRIFV